jgi:hypothetical protein
MKEIKMIPMRKVLMTWIICRILWILRRVRVLLSFLCISRDMRDRGTKSVCINHEIAKLDLYQSPDVVT